MIPTLLICLATISPSGQAQTPAASPDALVKAYVEAFNAGEDTMRQFLVTYVEASTPVETRLERYRRMKADMGTIEARQTTVEGAEVTAQMATKAGIAATFVFRLASTSPPRIRSMSVRLGGPEGEDGPPAPPLPPRDEKMALADLRVLVDRAASADEFSGAVLVSRGTTEPVFEHAVGYANRDRKVPNTLDTKFNIGSIVKHMTTVAVAQLVTSGRLALADTVGKFLPEYPNATVRDKVTVEMLLEMRSGLGDFFGPNYEKTPKSRIRSLEDYVPLFANEPLLFEPGQGRQYSNGGFVVLGLIVAKASGRSFYDYLQKHVFDAAGMTNTGFYPQSVETAGRAVGYAIRLGPPRRPNVDTLPERGSSAGGAYSTPRDLLRYVRALAGGKLVPIDALGRVGGRVEGIGIAGGAPGLNATLDTDVNGYTVVVMANYDPPAAQRVSQEARRILASVRK